MSKLYSYHDLMTPYCSTILPQFFKQNGLSSVDHQACLNAIRSRWPDYDIEEVKQQGACSWTLMLRRSTTQHHDFPTSLSRASSLIVQLRLKRHAIQPKIARDAKVWYPSLAPEWSQVATLISADERREALQVCCMEMLEGERASELTSSGTRAKTARLLHGLAVFHARAWRFADTLSRGGEIRRCDGRVGRTIGDRLRMLERRLPSSILRRKAGRCRERVAAGELNVLPIVLTHGDLIPTNILVDESTWELSGLVDWAEAEYLPFGLSLYCVDHSLGRMQRVCDFKVEWIWQENEQALRTAFWTELNGLIPGMNDIAISQAVILARDVGVLLWHGIAFDDGRIDRVVEPGKDDEELARLSSFLDISYTAVRASL